MTKFLNRRDAGQQLAAEIQHKLILNTATSAQNNIVVLGIPRGGVPVAEQVAHALHAPLDVFITRKIGAPSNRELALGAVASDGTVFLDPQLISALHISHRTIERERDAQLHEIQRRIALYRGGKPPLSVRDKTVILVDDGIATGATTIAALRALGHQHPARLILAVPVAPPQVIPQLRAECDELVVLHTPDPFMAVGYFYADFEQVTDEQVVEILKQP